MADAYASLADGEPPGTHSTSCVVTSAARRADHAAPPTLAAKLSPVPRRYVGYTRGR